MLLRGLLGPQVFLLGSSPLGFELMFASGGVCSPPGTRAQDRLCRLVRRVAFGRLAALRCFLSTVVFCTAAFGFLPRVEAGLGLGLASIEQGRLSFSSTLTVENHAGYSVYTHILPSATLVREYLSEQDEVFGVAWEGPFWPDFKTLLGPHYDAYVNFIKQRRRGIAVQYSDLIIESGGKMGAFSGRVYLPAKLPGGIPASVIR